jgi:hypothetical protein
MAKTLPHRSHVPRARRSKRVATKKPARLVINLGGAQRLVPCLILDRSEEGFRLRGNFKLKPKQLVELVVDDPMGSVQCEVVWIGKAGSERAGEAGVRTIDK